MNPFDMDQVKLPEFGEFRTPFTEVKSVDEGLREYKVDHWWVNGTYSTDVYNMETEKLFRVWPDMVHGSEEDRAAQIVNHMIEEWAEGYWEGYLRCLREIESTFPHLEEIYYKVMEMIESAAEVPATAEPISEALSEGIKTVSERHKKMGESKAALILQKMKGRLE